MKKIILLLAIMLVLFSAFSTGKDPGITGVVEPPDAVNRITAIKDNDSASVVPVNGRFNLVLKPGNWTLIVEAINPYKNYVQPVLVIEGAPTDVGVIRLMKQ